MKTQRSDRNYGLEVVVSGPYVRAPRKVQRDVQAILSAYGNTRVIEQVTPRGGHILNTPDATPTQLRRIAAARAR